jgi:hypothetical protein
MRPPTESRSTVVRHADNLAELARRGGALTARSRLLVVRCDECRAPFLYDEQADRLYVDPDDLTVVVEAASDHDHSGPCPGCGRNEWGFEDVCAAEVDDVLEGPWSFCFWAPAPDKPPRSRVHRALAGVAVGTLVLLGATALVFNPDPLAAPDKARKRLHVAG